MGAAANRNRYRQIADRYRDLPGRHGLREHRVYVQTLDETDGTQYCTEVEVLNNGQPPRVREATEQELEAWGYQSTALVVGPITPEHSSGGTAYETLNPSAFPGEYVTYRLTGPGRHADGDRYFLQRVKTDRALNFMVTLTPSK